MFLSRLQRTSKSARIPFQSLRFSRNYVHSSSRSSTSPDFPAQDLDLASQFNFNTRNADANLEDDIRIAYNDMSAKYQRLGLTPGISRELVALRGPHVFISNLTDPYLNLALETYIFDNMPVLDKNEESLESKKVNNNRLVLYKNTKCIVFGKNQNPWKEINFEYLKHQNLISDSDSINKQQLQSSVTEEKQFEILRRNSGGGTVIHDDGNLNYCFITTKNAFDRKTFSKIIVEEINNAYQTSLEKQQTEGQSSSQPSFYPKYPLTINGRGDLVVRFANLEKNEVTPTAINEAAVEYKVSGSAYKVSKGRSYHHGTMLLNCNLSKFSDILSKNGSEENLIIDKSVDSTRARIINLEMNEILFYVSLVKGFIGSYGILNQALESLNADIGVLSDRSFAISADPKDRHHADSQSGNNAKVYANMTMFNSVEELPDGVIEIANELKSWEFKYGKTPKFQHKIQNADLNLELTLSVEQGFVTDIQYQKLDEIQTNDLTLQNEIMALQAEVRSNSEKIKYSADDISKYFLNRELKQWLQRIIY